ncbi:MAG: endolytic transglycosylase MltG [Bacteroidia bacterium]|nr:endolytic transglycosylase MltG [Bacteroidia bacterium]MDW8133675.1 endolytic transglycosylase MltG [Bacteroidia bacterium]
MAHRQRTSKRGGRRRIFPRYPLQSIRFRRIAAIGLLFLITVAAMQFAVRVRLSAATAYRFPLDPIQREKVQDDIRQIFPPYVVWRWILPFTAVKAGYYEIKPTETCFEVWNRLRKGIQTPIRFYLRPQRTPRDLAVFLGRILVHDSSTWLKTFSQVPWENYGLNSQTWMLLFLPDVYETYWTISPLRLIERMKENYDRFWNEERRKKAESLGLTPVEVGILASIVEHESYRVSERPLIAGVYLNRLRLGMPLQADPTIIYAIGDFSINRVTHKMLEIDSPYNTYKRRGLPPGPIGMPSIESIEAVLHYTPSPYLYFCARPDGSGYHDFSETYEQHLIKARSYQKALNRWLAQKR